MMSTFAAWTHGASRVIWTRGTWGVETEARTREQAPSGRHERRLQGGGHQGGQISSRRTEVMTALPMERTGSRRLIVTVSWPRVHSTIVSLPSGASLNECQLYNWPLVLSCDGTIINRVIIVISVNCARLSGITTDSFG